METAVILAACAALFALFCYWRPRGYQRIRHIVAKVAGFSVLSAALAYACAQSPFWGGLSGGIAVLVVAAWPEILALTLQRLKPFRLYACFYQGRRLLVQNVLTYSLLEASKDILRSFMKDERARRFADLTADQWELLVAACHAELAICYLFQDGSIRDKEMRKLQRQILDAITDLTIPIHVNLRSSGTIYLDLATGVFFDNLSEQKSVVSKNLVLNQTSVCLLLDEIMDLPEEIHVRTNAVPAAA